ncbi:bifunctional phosphopantothenoylcysteine decarboxylase/phosphopantothenate--cysteine ligase CoaBC [bacterium]|nr:bifunctional phosphopantothenoylcysteine decarboxylase/phosphopantothenate--cysteine ligase CoaBC [bacterium]
MTSRAAERLLLGVTGSIAAYKAPELCREFRNRGVDVAVVMTEAATRFVGPLSFETMSGNPVGTDLFDARGAAALPHWLAGTPAARAPYHLALGDCADAILVAPATASFLAKMVHGVADDLLSTLLLGTSRPVAVAPAMNTRMWEHAATRDNLRALTERGVFVVMPDAGKMAWDAEGEGEGRLPDPAVVAEAVWHWLQTRTELRGKKIVVSAGGTQEPIDAVRVITNRSSGRMGVALAEEARDRGADVVLVAAGMSVPPPANVRIVRAMTAADMADAMVREAGDADAVLMAAAVADWRPAHPAGGKVKKDGGAPAIELEGTADILQLLREEAPKAMRVGFALETDDAVENGRRKLRDKDLDLIVVNDATEEGAAFDVDTNRVTLLDRDGGEATLPLLQSKRSVAREILGRVAVRLGAGPRTLS